MKWLSSLPQSFTDAVFSSSHTPDTIYARGLYYNALPEVYMHGSLHLSLFAAAEM